MKKLLLVLAIGAFAACNDGGGSEEKAADSTATTVDSAAMAPAPVDTTKMADTSAKKPADTTIKK